MSGPRNSRFIQLAAVLFLTAGACAHNAASTASTSESPSAPEKKAQLVSAAAAPAPNADADTTSGQRDLEAAVAELKGVDLFFGFNDDVLTERARGKLTTVADVLTKHPALKLKIEGNCDERGTEAYNLVLGQKRADSAKKYLTNLGVKPEQVATVSFGDERPKDPAHNEGAWKENRRDDVVVTSPTGSK